MKSIILFKSKYGATRQYAAWLAEMLELPIVDVDDATNENIRNNDALLIGTSVYFGKFKNARWLRQNVKELSTKKKIFMFIVCASAADSETCNKILKTNLPAEIKDKCTYYFLPGRVLHRQLSFFERLILNFAARFVKDPEKKQALHNDLDEVKKENLNPLIIAAKGFLTKAA